MSSIHRRAFLRRASALLTVSAFEPLLRSDGFFAWATDPGTEPVPRLPSAGLSGDELTSVFSEIVADLESKFPYASALYTAGDGITMNRNRQGKSVNASPFRGAGVSLRVFDGESFHEGATADTSHDAIRRVARELKRDVARARDRYTIQPEGPLRQSWQTKMELDPASLSLDERSARIDAEYERLNWSDPRIRNVNVSTNESRVHRIFVDRERQLRNRTTQVNHGAFMFGMDQGRSGSGFMRHVQQGGYEKARFSEAEIQKLRDEVVMMFGAERVPPGEYDVVFAPAVTGLLAHESFGHGVEMDQFVKERAKARLFLGRPVASNIVSLLDDPGIEGASGSYPFDDEGMLARPTTVIENGTFVSPLTDLMSATFLGRPRTPNGRTQAWDRKIYARMSNTYIARGTTDPAEIIASVKDGLYIDGFRNGIEDPQGWGIQFTARFAREIKDGAFTGRAFTPITVTGYVPDILSNITMVGNDFAIEPGSCGKGFKEFVPVGSGGPHVRTRARVS